MRRRTSWFFVFCFLVVSLQPSPALGVGCREKLALLAIGVPQEAHSLIMMPVDIVTGALSFFKRKGFIVTRRGILSYMQALGLRLEDLEGKTVLDLGAGRSPFAPAINKILGSRGTRAFSLDLNANPPDPRLAGFVRADAMRTPFRDSSMDMVVSNWFFSLFMPDWTNPQLTGFKKSALTHLVNESVRITKPDGEIRVSFPFANLGLKGIQFVRAVALRNPKVERVDVTWPRPFVGYIRIKLKPGETSL
jgi:SAM-dependent methyltransferase